MGIEEGTFWDEHWVLYGNQFDNKLHILEKKRNTGSVKTQVFDLSLVPILQIIFKNLVCGTEKE